eukprot:3719729-Pleurochrysis_carterae.AAC.1
MKVLLGCGATAPRLYHTDRGQHKSSLKAKNAVGYPAGNSSSSAVESLSKLLSSRCALGSTALSVAEEWGHRGVVEMLRRAESAVFDRGRHNDVGDGGHAGSWCGGGGGGGDGGDSGDGEKCADGDDCAEADGVDVGGDGGSDVAVSSVGHDDDNERLYDEDDEDVDDGDDDDDDDDDLSVDDDDSSNDIYDSSNDDDDLSHLDPGFVSQAHRMAPPLRRLLVRNATASNASAAAVIRALRLPLRQFKSASAAMALPQARMLLRARAALSPAACAALRDAVDRHTSGMHGELGGIGDADTVDGLPTYQLNLNEASLRQIIGDREMEGLLALPTKFHAQSIRSRENANVSAALMESRASNNSFEKRVAMVATKGTEAPSSTSPSAIETSSKDASSDREDRASCEMSSNIVPGSASDALRSASIQPPKLRVHQMFARRYSEGTRPWFNLHRDRAALTANVALSPDAAHTEGRLLALVNGRVLEIQRDEGEATVHPSALLHGVSRMRSGARYSLIIFFEPAA